MGGLFQGLEIGKRALLTHQLSMSIIGHNLANVSTPGYTRQRVNVASAMPIETANYNIGNGVTAENIVHIRDLFLTGQYRRENKSLGEWSYREKALGQVESLFNEPQDQGLGNVLNKFWSTWLDLSNNPESTAARSAVVSQSKMLTNAFHSLDRQLQEMYVSADRDVAGAVNDINQQAHEIANLNRMIVSEELGGQTANDLRDQRDLLIDQLSQIVDINTADKANGSTTVYVGGLAIVENADTFEFATTVASSGQQAKYDIVWKGSSTRVKIKGGELKGILDTRDTLIPAYREKLDTLARTIVQQVNAVHQSGTGLDGRSGRTFFNSAFTSAGTIQLDNAVEQDPSAIAASLSGEPGDNAVALSIADLRTKPLLSSGAATIGEFYDAVIGRVGIDSNEASTFKNNYEVLTRQIENSRQSVQGVSLDEEMAEMVRMQHSYAAAAKLITFIDQALEDLIHGMGVVGR